MRRNSGFSSSSIARVFLIGLIVLGSVCIVYAETQEKVIVISDRVGEIIDAEERAYFGLFAAYKGFKSAVFLQLKDGSYVAEVTYEQNGEEKKSRLSLSKQSMKSLRDYIDNYSGPTEVKPGLQSLEMEKKKAVKTPFNSGKVAVEILGGVGAGIIVGTAGGFIGGLIVPPKSSEEFDLGGIGLGFVIAYPIGSAIGVYIVGNMGNETGNLAATLGGSVLGVVVGIGTWFISVPQISLLCPPIGSVIGFNLTRRYKTPPLETGFINYRDNRLNLAVPSVYYTQNNTVKGKAITQNVTLFKVSF